MIPSKNVFETGDGRAWLLTGADNRDSGELRLYPLVGGQPGDPVFRAPSHSLDGWGGTVANDGSLWVTWAEPDRNDVDTVYVMHLEGGMAGPRIQVSTHGHNTRPTIVPDEYGNVWIFWHHMTDTERSIYMCRFGPRSGQATLVLRRAYYEQASLQIMSVETHDGTFTLLLAENLTNWYLVTGTEHQGFGEPVRIAAPPDITLRDLLG